MPSLQELHDSELDRFAKSHPGSGHMSARAQQHLLAGVPMPWMTKWAGSHSVFLENASGSQCVDIDGNTYLDFCLGDTGAMTGHALPQVSDALYKRAQMGITTMLPNEDALWVAEEMHRRFGLPTWQFAMSATDANRFVLRFARQLTGRSKIAVMDWCYHGTVDETLVIRTPDGGTQSRPGAIGPSVDPALTTRVATFNDIEDLERIFSYGDVACLLMEPALTNIGIVLPEPGYLEDVRELTRKHGVLLVIDETHTICVGPGGSTAAWKLEPDFLVIGKPIAGGMPAAAYGMTADIASRLTTILNDNHVDVSGVGGTLTANALALSAIRATLSSTLLEEDFQYMIPLATQWASGVRNSYEGAGLDWHVQQLGCRAEYWFCPPPKNGAEAAKGINDELDAFMHLFCLNRGILLAPFHNMVLLSPFHTQQDVDRHTEVFTEATTLLAGSV
ncbi:unannotated protein [freshwater metagenome]|uniref:Unannotated protein n=1 Tax=freshwater metagenome TaxID=449393 RepID=A0A6J6H0S5_9ZZZZ|nr:aminotransferase class III-fold pyridoxal phosphate-dependent enzyme [Actinomycetota bacterium]